MIGHKQVVSTEHAGSGGNAAGRPAALLSGFLDSSHNVIGIDIGAAYVKILQLQKNGLRYSVCNAVTRALPPAARENPVEKRKLVQELLREFISDARIKTRRARIALSGKGVFIFSLTVPQMNKKDLRGAVGIELKKRLPPTLDLNSVSFDYFIAGPAEDGKEGMVQLTCIAADRRAVDEEVLLLKEAGLIPAGIYTVPDSLGCLLPFCFDSVPKSAIALLDIGASVSQLNFYKGQNLIFSREIPIGGEHFTAAMARNLSATAQGGGVTADNAEKLKRNWGIPLDDEAQSDFLTDFGQFQGGQITMMLRPILERLVMEITRTVQYYVKTFKGEQVTELYLSGGSSRLKNIDKFLQANVEGLQKVQSLNILRSVKGWSERLQQQELVMEQAAPHLAVVFGLCLGNGGRVNLLPMKERLEQKANLLSMLLRFVFPAVLLLNLLLYAFVYFNGLKYQVLVTRLAAETRRLEPAARKVREYRERNAGFAQKRQLLDTARGRQPQWLGVMKELSMIVPSTITITKISTEEEKQPVRIRLSGVIFPPQYTIVDLALSQFVLSLEESPYFRQVELVSSKKNVYSSVPSTDFEIVCTLNY